MTRELFRALCPGNDIPYISGIVTKQSRYIGGFPVSSISIHLDNVMPEDLESLMDWIKKEARRVEDDWEDAFSPPPKNGPVADS